MSPGQKICGCMGCRKNADAIVEIDDYGQRAVCDEHATGQMVIADV